MDTVHNRIWIEDRSAFINQPDQVVIYDCVSPTVVGWVELGYATTMKQIRVAYDPVLNRGYAAYTGNDIVSSIDGNTFTLLSQVTVGDDPDAVAVHTGRGRAYVKADGRRLRDRQGQLHTGGDDLAGRVDGRQLG